MAEYDEKRNIKEKIQASFPERPVQGIKQMILSYETIQDDLIFPRVLISLSVFISNYSKPCPL